MIVVRGGGELGSAAARLLVLLGHPVRILEREEPLAVRRLVSFAGALCGPVEIEGVRAVGGTPDAEGDLVVVIDPEGEAIARLQAAAVVDARMLKGAPARSRRHPCFTVGLGPGFSAGQDVDAVVETQRGPDLGRVVWAGSAQADTAVPAPVAGVTSARVLRAPAAGRFRGRVAIGDVVVSGDLVAEVDGVPLRTVTSGLVRGLLADGVLVPAGIKVGDVDPRGRAVDAARISDKARTVAAGVVEALAVGLRGRGRVTP